MTQQRLQLLRTMPLFGGLSEAILLEVASHAPVVRVARGGTFFVQDAPADALFVLESGRVEVLRSGHGECHRLAVLSRGDCFGEMGLVDLGPRSATVRALQDCIALRVDMAMIQRFYQTDVKQFALIQMNLCREMSRRLREADTLLCD